jgi:hypothetical protein
MQNVSRNWKTTLSGILTILLGAFAIYTDHSKAADPTTMSMIVGGVGLILAKDASVAGVATN